MSHEHNPVDPELNAIASAFGSLTPSQGRLDRDLLMFRAGQASVRPASAMTGKRLWMAIAASTGLIALGEAAMLRQQPAPRIVEKIVVVRERVPQEEREEARAPATPPVVVTVPVPAFPAFGVSPGFGPTAYERLTAQVFRYGLDGLPTPPPARATTGDEALRPLTRQLWQEELLKTLEPGAPS